MTLPVFVVYATTFGLFVSLFAAALGVDGLALIMLPNMDFFGAGAAATGVAGVGALTAAATGFAVAADLQAALFLLPGFVQS